MNLRKYVQSKINQNKFARIMIAWAVVTCWLMAVGVIFHTMLLWIVIFPSIILWPLALVEFVELPEDKQVMP